MVSTPEQDQLQDVVERYGRRLLEELWLLGCDLRILEPLASHLSFRLGGPVDILAVPRSTEAFLSCLRVLLGENLPFRILGGGTNVVPGRERLGGIVVSTMGLDGVSVENGWIRVGAGVSVKKLCLFALELGLSGLEKAYGLPGTVGGAIFMNAGCYGWETAENVVEIEVFDGKKRFWLGAKDAEFGYRTSVFRRERGLIILGARLSCRPGERENIRGTMLETMRQRFEKQPLEYPSAGSVFKRPKPDFYVGTAIERLGLKGYRIGGAQVSQKHAGFIVNLGYASVDDVIRLIDFLKSKVRDAYGVELETEVEIWE